MLDILWIFLYLLCSLCSMELVFEFLFVGILNVFNKYLIRNIS